MAGCSASGSTNSSATPKVFVAAMEQATLRTLDPNNSYDPAWFIFGHALYSTLVTFNSHKVSQLEPLLAKSWDMSSDGMSCTFNLNPSAKFSDGSHVTAADVVFSFTRLENLKGVALFLVDNITSVKATSGETVVFTLKTADFTFPYILTSPSLGIIEPKVVQAHGGTDAANASTTDTAGPWLDEHSAGSGPYVLQSWTRGQQLVLMRNNNYWGPMASFPEIIFKFVSAPETEQLMLEKGQAAIAMDLSPAELTSVKSMSSIALAKTDALTQIYMGWVADAGMSPALANPENWTAIKYAINYQDIVTLAAGGAVQAGSLVPNALEGALAPSAGFHQDLAKATQALAAAGNPTGFSFTLTYAEDETAAGLPMGEIAQSLKSSLGQAGITMNLDPELAVNFLAAYRGATLPAVIHGWADDYPATSDFLPTFAPGGVVATREHWPLGSDNAITTLTNKAFETGKATTRDSMISQALTLLNQEGPYAPLLDTQYRFAYNKTLVSNVTANSLWWIDLESVTPAQ
jgi:peptide/nickel transport system substrate-binding protein